MATISSPARQPFGVIDGSRLKNLGNVKNVQNALSPSNTKSLKRSYDSTPDVFDTENIDPLMFSPSKKAKGHSSATPQKPHFVLKSAAAPSFTGRQIITPKRLAKKSTEVKAVSFSAPAAPAGRSPKSKRVGILSKRRTSGYGRVDPPAFGLNNSAPFSIDAALSGTVSSYKPTAPLSLDEAIPTGWLFEIHEDTPEEELGNLVQHSTQTLDISDDESKARDVEERGKENIPPDSLMAVTPVSRRDAMTDSRTPLGDLVASDFYAEGCDVNSYIIIDADVKEKSIEEKSKDTPTPSPSEANSSNQDVWKELLAQVEQKQETEQVPIEIWESESAKGDTETEKQEIAITTTLEECLAAADAREEVALASA